MALQAPSLMRAPAAQRSAPPRPSFSAPWSLRLPAPARRRVATAARITMRVASKQAYICRDCGWVSHSHPSGRGGAALYFARARRAAALALACRAVACPARMHAAVPVLVPDLLPLSVFLAAGTSTTTGRRSTSWLTTTSALFVELRREGSDPTSQQSPRTRTPPMPERRGRRS
ncbi:uncharacterized protein [Zea mays]|uniref:Uncharacterized protein n=1 Tax=Zea mays TaxID=4577 RepID=C0PPI9_MAIZE|nr:uncharacterized protein LOC100191834 isoform X1 [Zea mays]ACN37105.1 unknown [Zea mays]|eukprot:XP_008667065.1 uncharacterized protein LOC100191834 isoform X1 [Zea mays]